MATDYTLTCRQCGEDQKTRKQLYRHLATSHTPHMAIPSPQTSVNGKRSGVINHKISPVVESKTTMSYCKVCERYFANDGALRMHIENAKVHNNKVIEQRPFIQPKDGLNTHFTASSTIASTMLYGYQSYLGNTLWTPTYGIPASASPPEGYSIIELGKLETLALDGQARNSTSFSMQQSSTRQPAFETKRTSTAATSTHILQPYNMLTSMVSPSLSHLTADSNEASHHDGNERWSAISAPQQPAVLEALLSHRHSPEDLLKQQYRLRPYEPDDIAGLCKCKNCGGLRKKLQNQLRTNCLFHDGKRQITNRKDGINPYSCCGEMGQGCILLPTHDYAAPDRRLAAKYRDFAPTPPSSRQNPKHRAVIIDCEMAGVVGGMSEMILVRVVDYLTGETLMNTLVRPTKTVIDWRTRFSGVRPATMVDATVRGKTLNGWREARAEIWKHIDADTVLVGHALQNDLDVLRMIHLHIVDSAIIARNAVGPVCSRQWGLKTLCYEFRGIEIQNHGKSGHDCLEDTLAAREVTLWCTREVESLKVWAERMREEEVRKKKEREEKREKEKLEKKRLKMEKDKVMLMNRTATGIEEEYDDEVLRWSDIAEDLGWPHPDTGYDPWSD